jgi:hypothetical protein
MKETDKKRMNILKKIINTGMIEPDEKRFLSSLPWDYDGQSVVIRNEDIVNILQCFLDSKISAARVHDWADFLEMRDDIDFEFGDDSVSKEVLHALATPQTNEVLDSMEAKKFIQKIQSQN